MCEINRSITLDMSFSGQFRGTNKANCLVENTERHYSSVLCSVRDV